jgi:hypothetical protein
VLLPKVDDDDEAAAWLSGWNAATPTTATLAHAIAASHAPLSSPLLS